MKTLTTIIAITFALFASTANAQTKFINDGTAANNVQMNKIGTNGAELKFEMGANGSYVKWQTATESNTSHFELQVSNDNKSFATIRTVAASDVTDWAANYQTKFIRNYLSVEKVYYRLKTVFNNGTEVITAATTFEVANNSAVSFANVH